MLVLGSFLILSLLVGTISALAGIQVYAGVSCGYEDCAQNLTTAVATLGGCYQSCHPCIPGQCQYQYFQPLDTSGTSFQQYLCGNDATCTLANCQAYLNYSCGTCVNLTMNTNYRFAVKVTCPIERDVGGTIDCTGPTCKPLANVSAALNKCYHFCNPCNSACEYATYQAFGTTVMSYGYGTDSLCLPGNAVFKSNYSCDSCNTAIQGQSTLIPCPQTTNANIAQNMNEPVVASAAAAIIQADANLPSTVTIKTLAGAALNVDGVFTVNVPITSTTTLTPAQLTAVRNVIAANIAQQFNILPVSRVTVVLSKKRSVDGTEIVSHSAFVTITASSGYTIQPMLVMTFASVLLALLAL